jgi:hypothetical protein
MPGQLVWQSLRRCSWDGSPQILTSRFFTSISGKIIPDSRLIPGLSLCPLQSRGSNSPRLGAGNFVQELHAMSKKLQKLGRLGQTRLSNPDVMAEIRDLAVACLDDPASGRVDAIPFPRDKDNPHDWSPVSLERERGISEGPVLTPGQIALVLAAFQSNYVDVHCPGMEKVLVVSYGHFDGWEKAPSQAAREANGRRIRWEAIRNRVGKLGDWAQPWLSNLWEQLCRSIPNPIAAGRLFQPSASRQDGSPLNVCTDRGKPDSRGADMPVDSRGEQPVNEIQRAPTNLPIENQGAPPPTKESKPRNAKGSAICKLESGLLAHHKYENGACENYEPIGNNKLAEKLGVSKAAASNFFKRGFGEHKAYEQACRDRTRLCAKLKVMAKDYSEWPLYGHSPPEEGSDLDK